MQELKRQHITREIKRIRALPGRLDYGSPRVHQELIRSGIRCSKNTVAKFMKSNGWRASSTRKFRPTTTDSKHDSPIADNLLSQEFAVRKLNRVWLTDFTDIPLKEGFNYLCTVMDLCSRKIVGWAASTRIDANLAIAALQQAIALRAPKPGLIVHSDRGSQFASLAFRKVLEQNNCQQSMSRQGNCYDNAPMESFFKSFKVESIHRQKFETHEAATRAIINYIDRFYNSQRLHSSLNYQSPHEFEIQLRDKSIDA